MESDNTVRPVIIGQGDQAVRFPQNPVAVPCIVNIIFLTTNPIGAVIELVRSVFRQTADVAPYTVDIFI